MFGFEHECTFPVPAIPTLTYIPVMWMLLFRQSTSKLLPRMSITTSSDCRVVLRYSARVSEASGCCQQWGRLYVCSLGTRLLCLQASQPVYRREVTALFSLTEASCKGSQLCIPLKRAHLCDYTPSSTFILISSQTSSEVTWKGR